MAHVWYKARQLTNERHVSLQLRDYFCIGNEVLHRKRPDDDDDDDVGRITVAGGLRLTLN